MERNFNNLSAEGRIYTISYQQSKANLLLVVEGENPSFNRLW